MAGEKTIRRLRAIECLIRVFQDHARTTGCSVYTPGMAVLLPSGDTVYPDAILHRGTLAVAEELRGAPDLIVQILHNSTPDGERVLKRTLYERNGVKEYWIMDVMNSTIEVLALRDSRYDTWGAFGAAGTLTSPSFPGLAVPMNRVFA
jgi:Uma2 family endonuclease